MERPAPGDPVELCDRLSAAALLLARRLADGATMWILAPDAPEHARHVAVEFVHPVIVGKRALPAVSVTGPDHVAALRSVVRGGDVLVAVSALDDALVRDVLRRAPAWGLTTIWVAWQSVQEIDAMERAPAPVDALLLADGGPVSRYDGAVVRLYHVLWELTHVCFEHPGLLRSDTSCDDEVSCTTCADEGRLGEVVAFDGGPDATVRTARGVERVDVSLVGEVAPDDLVLVHAGSALTVVDGAG